MSGGLPADRLQRILDAVDTIEDSLGVLARKRRTVDREAYKNDSDTRDIVERRFVKTTDTDYCKSFRDRPHAVVRSTR